jgi:hypothetical protein
VFALRETAEWQVFVKVNAVLWNIIVSFPRDFPFVPPIVRLIAAPRMNGVSGVGRVDVAWNPGMRLVGVIDGLRGALVNVEAPKGAIPSVEFLEMLIEEIVNTNRSLPEKKQKVAPVHAADYSLITWKPIRGKAAVCEGLTMSPGDLQLLERK